MTSNLKEDFLEVDQSVPGQNYVCLSFLSPENVLKQKEMYYFHRFMTQRCGEFEKKIGEIVKDSSDELKDKIQTDLVDVLQQELRFTYQQFKDKYDDFTYKFSDELQKEFDNDCKSKTNVRGVKIRGVYDSYNEAQIRAKALQRRDRSFHVFVGQVGYWLPWDPTADKIQNEEYLEEELNTLMKEYKENEIRKDLFYEEQKREKQQDAMKKRMEAEKAGKVEEVAESLEKDDPWVQSKFPGAEPSLETVEVGTSASETGSSENNASETGASAPETGASETGAN